MAAARYAVAHSLARPRMPLAVSRSSASPPWHPRAALCAGAPPPARLPPPSCASRELALARGSSPLPAVSLLPARAPAPRSVADLQERAHLRKIGPEAVGTRNQSPKLSTQILHTEDQLPPRTMDGKMIVLRSTVELTEMEQRIFEIFTSTIKHFGLKTQPRVAGGWVRDKKISANFYCCGASNCLLKDGPPERAIWTALPKDWESEVFDGVLLIGKNSVDIDIALDDMLGREFCEKINEYLELTGKKTHSVGVIRSNPENSKHLETANMQVLDMRIDFSNLRAETYAETTRIPEMEFGSPEQDAYRRDLTINSLFYNIVTGKVEDFTQQGINDLKSGIIRTPMAPDATFLDDPLRVLRAIRFGARFDFELDADLKKAAAFNTVRTALGKKVSRERVGHEVELMLLGNQPVKAMQYVEDLSLFSTVFWLPEETVPDPPLPEHYGRLCVNALKGTKQVFENLKYASKFKGDEVRWLLFGAFFLPLHSCTCFDKKKKQVALSSYMIRESLKLKNNDASAVETLHATAMQFQSIITKLLPEMEAPDCVEGVVDQKQANVTDLVDRVELGLLLKHSKELWRGSLLLAAVMDLPSVTSSGASVERISPIEQIWTQKRVRLCNIVEDLVIEFGLTNVWKSKPLLDGKEIMKALNLDAGVLVREWVNKVSRWQLAHPQGSSSECRDWLVEENAKRMRTQ